MERLIFHVDVNSAFLSWEATRRVSQGEPDIRLIPSAIGGDREKRTGVILAKSIPAKKYGIKTGEPVAMALRKCPDLFLARPDFKLYEQSSKAFMDICREIAPVVEKVSIDECFLDMTGTHRIYPDPSLLRILFATGSAASSVLPSMWVSAIASCWPRWPVTLKSRIRYILYTDMRSQRKCGHSLWAICFPLVIQLQKNWSEPA